jgi:signal transduction histidine kinase
VARLEGGRLAQQPARVEVSEIINEVVNLFEHRAKEQGITLTYSCECSLPVHADPGNIEKVMNNLISNAINYSPDGGRVSVCARPAGKFVEITVSDTGVGIPLEELPKIFDKFYRVKHPKTRHVTGTGLGLSLVKGIVDACCGKIEVKSVPDQGTSFQVLLPLMEENKGLR